MSDTDKSQRQTSEETMPDSPIRLFDIEDPPRWPVVLDSIESIVLSTDEQTKFYAELLALDTLARGLDWLFWQVHRFESTIVKQHPSLSNPNAGQWADLPVVACVFQWYAVSACNYAWLVGWLAERTGQISTSAKEYRNRAAGDDLVNFRDKIAAHFAKAMTSRHDSDADKLASILSSLTTFSGGHFSAPVGVAGTIIEDDKSESSVWPWSLAEAHARFFQRYWARDAEIKGDGRTISLRTLPLRKREAKIVFEGRPGHGSEVTVHFVRTGRKATK